MSRAWFGIALAAGSAGLVCGALVVWNETGSRANLVQGKLEPVIALAGSRAGGAIREVYVRPGEHVRKGQPLLRFDAHELRARRQELAAIAHAAESAAGIPSQLRSRLVETDPDVTRVESDYVHALQQFDQATEPDRVAAQRRLNLASENRQRVRRRIGRELSDQSAAAPALLRNMRRRLNELDQLIEEADVRAPADALVDILDVKPGDRILPGHPAAALALSGEYFSDLAISSAQADKLQIGMMLEGILEDTHQPMKWRVESISKRTLPQAFRDERQTSEEILLRARISSPSAIRPGAIFDFQMP
jgi:multidrug efflux pump subunit AcrA (membrane-fusion protein)